MSDEIYIGIIVWLWILLWRSSLRIVGAKVTWYVELFAFFAGPTMISVLTVANGFVMLYRLVQRKEVDHERPETRNPDH